MRQNEIKIHGTVGKDVITKTTLNGTLYCHFDVVTNDFYKYKGASKKEETWYRISAFSEIAQKCEGLKKGDKVCLCGLFTHRSYTDQKGEFKKFIQINIDEIHELPKRSLEQSEFNYGKPKGLQPIGDILEQVV